MLYLNYIWYRTRSKIALPGNTGPKINILEYSGIISGSIGLRSLFLNVQALRVFSPGNNDLKGPTHQIRFA